MSGRSNFMKRHALTYRKIREMIASGAFKPAAGFIKYSHWPATNLKWMLLAMSIHPIDLAIGLLGDVAEITSVMYQSERAISLAITLRFASGKWMQLMLDSSQPRIQERVEISGAMDAGNALIVVDNIIRMELHRQGMNGIDLVTSAGTPGLHEIDPVFDLDDIKTWRPDYGIPNMGQNSPFLQGYAGEVREFADAILDHREPWPGTDDTTKAMRVIDAICRQPKGITRL